MDGVAYAMPGWVYVMMVAILTVALLTTSFRAVRGALVSENPAPQPAKRRVTIPGPYSDTGV